MFDFSRLSTNPASNVLYALRDSTLSTLPKVPTRISTAKVLLLIIKFFNLLVFHKLYEIEFFYHFCSFNVKLMKIFQFFEQFI